MSHAIHRDYDAVRPGSAQSAPTRDDRAQAAIDALWSAFGHMGYSWVGIYTIDAARTSMLLACRQPKPACSPIGLQGCCGRCWREQRPLLVHDVLTLGDGYIACDPRDRSEVVIPLFDDRGACWGVLDVDSFDVGAFTEHDVRGLTAVVQRCGISTRPQVARSTLQL